MKYVYRAQLGDGVRTCTGCDETKPLEEFHRDHRSVDGRCARCKVCSKVANRAKYERNKESVAARMAAYYRENAEHLRKVNGERKARERLDPEYRKRETAFSREWRRRNPRKVQAANARARAWGRYDPDWTDQEWADLLERSDYACLCCGSIEDLTPDHVIPLSRGGANTIDNIQPLCLPCNRRKYISTTDYREALA
jgi:5-methylcytosine-specific restriction endonuclease McrA